MTHDRSSRLEMDGRRWLKLGATSFVAASLPRTLLGAQPTPQACSPPIPLNHEPSNGGPCPYPIPWLDKNGNHNQIPPCRMSNSRTSITSRKVGALQRLPRHGYG